MPRPESTEYAPYYEKYITLVPENDILDVMRRAPDSDLGFLAGVPESEASVCHPPYTWTTKQVVGHLTDSERVFGYRALRFARGDHATPLPGFDENAYARAIRLDDIPLRRLSRRVCQPPAIASGFFQTPFGGSMAPPRCRQRRPKSASEPRLYPHRPRAAPCLDPPQAALEDGLCLIHRQNAL